MRLTFVGDIALGDHPKTVGFGFRSRYATGIPTAYDARLRPPGDETEFLFGNLEFSLGYETNNASDLARSQCRGLAEYAAFLARAGVSALNVANNHSTQAGPDVLSATTRLLRESGIHVVGTPADFSPAGIVQVGDQSIALLGWSDRPRQYAPDTPVYNELSSPVYEQIAAARQRADVVIASIHWGDEFILVPSERERGIAHAMIDAGATCVIGHHPHVVREIEEYRGGVIAYSLGNFVCDMTWNERTRFTGWLDVEIEAGAVRSWSFVPGIIDDDYFPTPLAEGVRSVRAVRNAEARQRDAARIASEGYQRAAALAQKRHVMRTALMMLRNIHRYERRIALSAFRDAIAHRVHGLLTGRGSAPDGRLDKRSSLRA